MKLTITLNSAPSSLRPSVRYPGKALKHNIKFLIKKIFFKAVKNSLNKPDSILKDIVGPCKFQFLFKENHDIKFDIITFQIDGGGLRALFRGLI